MIQSTGDALENKRQGLSLKSQPSKMSQLSINKIISGGDKCNKENKVMGRNVEVDGRGAFSRTVTWEFRPE